MDLQHRHVHADRPVHAERPLIGVLAAVMLWAVPAAAQISVEVSPSGRCSGRATEEGITVSKRARNRSGARHGTNYLSKTGTAVGRGRSGRP